MRPLAIATCGWIAPNTKKKAGLSAVNDSYLRSLRTHFERHGHPEHAPAMERYLRHQFQCLGIKTPERTTLFKQFVREQGLPELNALPAVLLALWALPQREFQYVGCDLLEHFRKQLTPDLLLTVEQLITTRSWWDTVDSLAIHTVGTLCHRYPEAGSAAIEAWRCSDNIWLRRTTLLFQLMYKTETDQSLLFALIQDNAASQEFFLQKAIGWALREYSKTHAQAVEAFVATHRLAPLSRREALKWLKARS
jgi:3-methyladenine DNA glycosylase AlkD